MIKLIVLVSEVSLLLRSLQNILQILALQWLGMLHSLDFGFLTFLKSDYQVWEVNLVYFTYEDEPYSRACSTPLITLYTL